MSDIKFDYPKDEPSMICTRSFDAPRRTGLEGVHHPRACRPLVGTQIHRAGQDASTSSSCRKGGEWRFICERPDGSETIVFYGIYVDVVPEKKLANTLRRRGAVHGDEAFPEVHTFEERDGRTYYKSYALLPNFEARDAVVATGMEKGGRESMEQLGDLVDELARETV